MPQTKQKPAAAAAEPIQPEPPKPTAKELRKAETEQQFAMLQDFIRELDSIGTTGFTALKTFMLIQSRDRGSTTPIENFLVSLIHLYDIRDGDGKGLTLEDINWEMRQDLTDDDALERTIKEAHFLATRYPLAESQRREAKADAV